MNRFLPFSNPKAVSLVKSDGWAPLPPIPLLPRYHPKEIPSKSFRSRLHSIVCLLPVITLAFLAGSTVLNAFNFQEYSMPEYLDQSVQPMHDLSQCHMASAYGAQMIENSAWSSFQEFKTSNANSETWLSGHRPRASDEPVCSLGINGPLPSPQAFDEKKSVKAQRGNDLSY
jgi:hypothetical protein